MSEWKSAFEIEGFLSGETEIVDTNGCRFKFHNGRVEVYSLIQKKWMGSSVGINFFTAEVFKKYEEPKKEKWYVHEYWELSKTGHKYFSKVKTRYYWDAYTNYDREPININQEVENE